MSSNAVASPYRHFADRDHLLAAVAAQAALELADRMRGLRPLLSMPGGAASARRARRRYPPTPAPGDLERVV